MGLGASLPAPKMALSQVNTSHNSHHFEQQYINYLRFYTNRITRIIVKPLFNFSIPKSLISVAPFLFFSQYKQLSH